MLKVITKYIIKMERWQGRRRWTFIWRTLRFA